MAPSRFEAQLEMVGMFRYLSSINVALIVVNTEFCWVWPVTVQIKPLADLFMYRNSYLNTFMMGCDWNKYIFLYLREIIRWPWGTCQIPCMLYSWCHGDGSNRKWIVLSQHAEGIPPYGSNDLLSGAGLDLRLPSALLLRLWRSLCHFYLRDVGDISFALCLNRSTSASTCRTPWNE